MTFFPQSQPVQRAARAHFAEPTPAVLRLKDGRRIPGHLKTVSVTGGLLSVPHPLDTGSNGKLMFLTEAGMVLGAAEMLSPMSWSLQPFRFVALDSGDKVRLQTAVRSYVEQHRVERGQIERSRAW
jgi:hypothetical protein